MADSKKDTITQAFKIGKIELYEGPRYEATANPIQVDGKEAVITGHLVIRRAGKPPFEPGDKVPVTVEA